MKVLLLGAAGQVGLALQAELAAGYDLVALGRDQANLEEKDGLARAIAETAPRVIVNAAAYTAVDRAESEPDRAERINAAAVGELARMAADRGARDAARDIVAHASGNQQRLYFSCLI